MKHIIQQIAQELVEKIIKKAYSGKISDIDVLTEDVLADCKASAARVVEVILSEMNKQIRQDKQARRKLEWSIFEKQDPNFDGASGTQILLHKTAQLRNLTRN